MQEVHHDRIARLFRQHGLRCTRQRYAIYRALAATTAHPTADELYRSVRGSIEGLSLATVYNSLEAFCDAGLAMRLAANGSVRRGGGAARYDAAVDEHLHVRCTQSGRVADVPDELGRRLLQYIPGEVVEELGRALGFRVDHLNIELIGRFESSARRAVAGS